jgi:hypothetical protein
MQKPNPLVFDRSERFKRSLVCTSSLSRSLRPRPGKGVLHARGWAGEQDSLFEQPAFLANNISLSAIRKPVRLE